NPEVLTKTSSTDVHRLFWTGRYAYHTNHSYYLKTIAGEPQNSKLAPKKARIAMYPGTGATYMWTDSYVVNARTKALEDAWKLTRFVGGNLTGNWYVQRSWRLIAGPVNSSPRGPSPRGAVRLAPRPAGVTRDLRRRPAPAPLLALALLHRRQRAPDQRPGARALRCPGAAVPVGGASELRRHLRRSAVLELALAHALLRRGLRARGHTGRTRHGAHPERALRRASAAAQPAVDPVVAVPSGGGA